MYFSLKLDRGSYTSSLLLKLHLRNLEPYSLYEVLFVRGCAIVMFGLALLFVTCTCWISCINGYVGLLTPLTTSFETLVHGQNVACLSLFYRFLLEDVHLNWLNWLLFFSGGRSTCYIYNLHDFSITIRRYCKNVMSTKSFLV